jgi:hypothetical protein
MHVIGHHDVRVRGIVAQFRAANKAIYDTARNLRIAQPLRACRSRIQPPIGAQELFSGSSMNFSRSRTKLRGNDPCKRQVRKIVRPSGCQCGKFLS